MTNGSSRILTDKVGGFALLGLGIVGATFLGLRSRGPKSEEPTPVPQDPGITTIEINPLPDIIQDGENVEFQIVVEGGSGSLGGDFDFGDGAIVSFDQSDVVGVREGVFNIILNHTYNLGNPETRDVQISMQIQDSASGILNEAFAAVRVNPVPIVEPPPLAIIQDFNQSVISGISPLNVGFSVSPSDARSQIIWDFGDGSPQVLNQQQLSHLYSGEGTINGFVDVTNSSGESDRINFSVTLQADIPPPPGTPDIISNFFQSEGVIMEDGFVSFSIALGVVERLIRWRFGDGTADVLNVLAVDHQYRSAGTFAGFVEVEAQDGSIETRNFTVTVNASQLRPTNRIDLLFSGSLDVGESFAARANPGGGVPPFVNFDWNLGDGNRISGSDKMNIGHQYLQPGTFTITCEVTDSAGQKATASRTVTVEVAPLQFGDATVNISENNTNAGDLRITIKNNRSDIRIDGRLRVLIFDGRNQLDTRTVFPTINPGQTVTEFYIFKSSLPEGRTLRAISDYKDNATSRLLDDDIFDFVITPEVSMVKSGTIIVDSLQSFGDTVAASGRARNDGDIAFVPALFLEVIEDGPFGRLSLGRSRMLSQTTTALQSGQTSSGTSAIKNINRISGATYEAFIILEDNQTREELDRTSGVPV